MVSLLGVLTAVTFAVMLGYAFAWLDWPGKRVMFAAILVSMMTPAFVSLVPTFLLVKRLGLFNKWPGLSFVHLAYGFGTFLSAQFFKSIPREIFEAAEMDGAGMLDRFVKVALPMAKPLIGLLAILVMLWSYNNVVWHYVTSSGDAGMTLPVAAWKLAWESEITHGLPDPPAMMAGAVLGALPLALLFVKFSGTMIRGISEGAIR
jgi:sn-glycerol 3-phosphate transport system permease protein